MGSIPVIGLKRIKTNTNNMTNLKQDIEKELEDFNFAFDGMDETGLITKFIDKALKRIAHKTAEALEMDEKSGGYGNDNAFAFQNGYNKCVSRLKENKDKYLK